MKIISTEVSVLGIYVCVNPVIFGKYVLIFILTYNNKIEKIYIIFQFLKYCEYKNFNIY